MLEENLLQFSLLLCLLAMAKKKKPKRSRRRFKIRPINRARNSRGGFVYFRKMKSWDEPQFFKYTRMTVPVFNKLLTKIQHKIKKKHCGDGIKSEQRLVITLQYLSQGVSMQSLAWTFQIGHATVHQIIHETCAAIWDCLSEEYLKAPSTTAQWLNISKGFEERWNFPHCLGALDGKHVNIQAPANSGSLYFNYKKTFSIVLLAACDSKYRFTHLDIGAYGSQSDGGIFKNSVFGQLLDRSDLQIPKSKPLDGTDLNMPYFLVADEAFPLKSYIMRPYPGKNLSLTARIFNYRLSRARQVIENTFGILVARWRILKTNINAKVENVDNIVKAVVVLHNYCQIELGGNMYCPVGFVDSDDSQDGQWREEITPLESVGRVSANVARRATYQIRDTLASYFICDVGQVPWQNDIIEDGSLMTKVSFILILVTLDLISVKTHISVTVLIKDSYISLQQDSDRDTSCVKY